MSRNAPQATASARTHLPRRWRQAPRPRRRRSRARGCCREPAWARGADEHARDVGVAQLPGKRHLGKGLAAAGGDVVQAHDLVMHVARQGAPPEAARVVGHARVGRHALEVAVREQPLRKRREREMPRPSSANAAFVPSPPSAPPLQARGDGRRATLRNGEASGGPGPRCSSRQASRESLWPWWGRPVAPAQHSRTRCARARPCRSGRS